MNDVAHKRKIPAGLPLRRRRAEVRAERQRGRILDAAEQCFIDSGFDAASVMQIAVTAGMSPGLIYRYFDSKGAIVKAIIARHLKTEGADVDGVDSPEEACRRLIDLYERWRRGDDPKMNAALCLELTAASSRDPQIGQAVRDRDQEIGQAVTQMMRRAAARRGVQLSAAAARSRAVILQCLVEGLASRAVREPTLTGGALKPALEAVITVLMG